MLEETLSKTASTLETGTTTLNKDTLTAVKKYPPTMAMKKRDKTANS